MNERVGRDALTEAGKPYLKVSLIYLVVGLLWIVGSDWVVATISRDAEMLNFLQMTKGWGFVVVSSILIFLLAKRSFQKLRRAEKAKSEIFRSTLAASDHILLNYLNQMQLVTIEANECEGFDKEVLEISKRITDETVTELKRLEEIEVGGSADIEAFLSQRIREARKAVQRVNPEA